MIILLVLLSLAVSSTSLAGGIIDGQPVNAAVTNPAFIFKNADDSTTHILGLQNTDISNGPFLFTSIQKALNTLDTASGSTESVPGTAYGAPAGTITNGDNYQTALKKVADKFHATTGHQHTGAAGDGPILVGYLQLTGGTMSGTLNMGNNFITNILDPANPQDAATKNYSDTHLFSSLITGISGGIPYFSSTTTMGVVSSGTAGQFLTSNGAGTPTWSNSGAITSLNSQTGATQIFANDTNITITSASNTHTLGWTGTLSLDRGGTAAALTAGAGKITYSTASALALSAVGTTGTTTSGDVLRSNGTSAPSWYTFQSSPGALTIMSRDTSDNSIVNNIIQNMTSNVSGTYTLVQSSSPIQIFTGAGSSTLTFPAAGGLYPGWQYQIKNRATGTVTVKDGGGGTLLVLAAGTECLFTLISPSGLAGVWDNGNVILSGGITTLNTQSGTTQIFANDTNVSITSSSNTHSLGWIGTLAMSRGGTGAALTGTVGTIPYFVSSSVMGVVAAGTSGQILASNGASAPTWQSFSGTLSIDYAYTTGATTFGSVDTNVALMTTTVSQTGNVTVSNSATLGTSITTGPNDGIYTAYYTCRSSSSPVNFCLVTGGITDCATPDFTGHLLLIRQPAANTAVSGAATFFLSANTKVKLTADSAAASSLSVCSLALVHISNGVGGTGLTSLNLQTGNTQVFSNDTNVTITSSNNTHALGWTSTLSLSRGGTGNAITGLAGGIIYNSTTTAMNVIAAGTSGQSLFSGGAGAPTWKETNGQSFVTAGPTYTTPANISTATVFKLTMVGGGGGGGGISTNNGSGAGGGAGGTCIVYVTGLSPSTGYTVAIGAAGAAGATTPTAGGAGGNTTFAGPSLTYTAAGGSGGAATVSTNGGAGGTTTNCTIGINGQNGGASASAAASSTSGRGGSSFFGQGGANIIGSAGLVGTGYGSGGSGGNGNPNAGGAGSVGVILVEWEN